MKTLFTLIAAFCITISPVSAAETKTLISGDAATDTLTLAEGESAKLVYAQNRTQPPVYSNTAYGLQFNVDKAGKVFAIPAWVGSSITQNESPAAPVEIAGPATIRLLNNFSNDPGLATFTVTRVGIAGEPAAIPQEPGSIFQVILESSSDLVNWTAANPGEYTGSEVKRFFRTRIVKKP